ncbi:MAG TPA: hypothetical protein VFQ86_00675 [Arachidicoccus soli]|nr:hypothetical protein [Arachidicoccus soli]
MKKYILLIAFSFTAYVAMANSLFCEAQPSRNLNGRSQGGILSYTAIFIMVIITVGTLFLSVKLIFKPGEKSKTHIKRTILKEE